MLAFGTMMCCHVQCMMIFCPKRHESLNDARHCRETLEAYENLSEEEKIEFDRHDTAELLSQSLIRRVVALFFIDKKQRYNSSWPQQLNY